VEKAWVVVGQKTRADIVKAKKRADLSFLRRRIRFFGLMDDSVCMMVQDWDCWTLSDGVSVDGCSRWRRSVLESHIIFVLFAMTMTMKVAFCR